MGMLATVMNSLVLEAAITRNGAPATTLFGRTDADRLRPLLRAAARSTRIDAGRVVLLAGGTGNPFFTTDTTAVLRAAELDCQAVLKATNVDGVYSADPKLDKSATRYDRLSPARRSNAT